MTDRADTIGITEGREFSLINSALLCELFAIILIISTTSIDTLYY
jgi:hypothetical protein